MYLNSFAVVLRVGTDILFSLACIHDFKQEMLASAIKDGLLEVKKTKIHVGDVLWAI